MPPLLPSHGAPTAVLLPPNTVGLLQMFLCVYKKEERLLASLHRAIQLARPPHHILPPRSPSASTLQHLFALLCLFFFPDRINAFPHAEPKIQEWSPLAISFPPLPTIPPAWPRSGSHRHISKPFSMSRNRDRSSEARKCSSSAQYLAPRQDAKLQERVFGCDQVHRRK